MRRLLGSLALLIAGCSNTWDLPGTSAAPVSEPSVAASQGEYATAVRNSQRILSLLLDRYPGLAVAVSVRGNIVWSQGFGFADLERSRPVTAETQFRIYSLSKALTAAALMHQVEKGRVDLDAPVERYVKGWPDSALTVGRLAGHLGGIRHYRGSEGASTRACGTIEEAIAGFRHDPFVAPPGIKFAYSSYGYVLLSSVIERASGEPFATAIAEEVLGAAGMVATVIEDPKQPTAQQATFYEQAGKRVKIGRFVDNRCKWGAGAFLSTAEDMVRFGAALLEGRIVEPRSVERMLTEMKTVAGEGTGYGMGLGVRRDSTGVRIATHSGGAIGGRSAIVLLPDDHITVAVLANIEGDKLLDEAVTIAMEFRAAPQQEPRERR